MDNEQLVVRIRAGEDVADNMLQLWQQNKGFIRTLARKYAIGAEIEDLEQEGYIGLCDAVNQYDPDKGMSFISYAAFWIRRRLRECVANNRGIHLSASISESVHEYYKFNEEYYKLYGFKPSDREMCALLGTNEKTLKTIKQAGLAGQIRSLSEPVAGAEDSPNIEETIISDETLEDDVIFLLDTEKMKRELWFAVNELPDELSGVIRMKYIDGLTLREIGQITGIGVENARKTQYKALKMLEQRSHRYKFRKYVEEYLTAAPVHHVGVQRFRETWTSEVEQEALRRA